MSKAYRNARGRLTPAGLRAGLYEASHGFRLYYENSRYHVEGYTAGTYEWISANFAKLTVARAAYDSHVRNRDLHAKRRQAGLGVRHAAA